MNPINPPRLHGEPLGMVRLKSRPEDFQVEERLGFEPSGDGEHCLIWVEKSERNTNDVATLFAKKLGIRKRLVSHCGMKDNHAITRQWFSLHLPGQASPSADDLADDGIRILSITRNLRKLHRGSHDGNRFLIRLRECDFSEAEVNQRWQQISDRGVPNYFGPQRFGRDGGNVDQARRFMSGEIEVRDRPLRGILISAARSFIFNACVARRVEQGNWDTPLRGEVFGFADNRSLVLPGNVRGDEAERVRQKQLELTSPLWGQGDLISENEVKRLEESVVQDYPEIIDGLASFNLQQERRVMRLRAVASQLNWEDSRTLVLQFDLAKGTYATTVLRELVDWH
ncbi:tRNA pseudouridine(13) synthase TruD [Novipirellula caenicola]|uniref:tRNA pseudouridine synthase D n=1 Tax=Novipirellula caenicola TaxID=1536901 RepID=A0ABP9VXL1_9BACT